MRYTALSGHWQRRSGQKHRESLHHSFNHLSLSRRPGKLYRPRWPRAALGPSWPLVWALAGGPKPLPSLSMLTSLRIEASRHQEALPGWYPQGWLAIYRTEIRRPLGSPGLVEGCRCYEYSRRRDHRAAALALPANKETCPLLSAQLSQAVLGVHRQPGIAQMVVGLPPGVALKHMEPVMGSAIQLWGNRGRRIPGSV